MGETGKRRKRIKKKESRKKQEARNKKQKTKDKRQEGSSRKPDKRVAKNQKPEARSRKPDTGTITIIAGGIIFKRNICRYYLVKFIIILLYILSSAIFVLKKT